MIISGVTISGTSIGDGYNVLTNNALLSLDAGNPASYSSGSTWYDLSGNGWNATSFSGMTYSSNNGGYFTFNGSGSATLASGVYNKTYTGKSVFVVANCTAISNGTYRAFVGNNGPNARNFNFYLYNSGGQNFLHSSTNSGGGLSTAMAYTVGSWGSFGFSMDTAGNQTYYYNGNVVSATGGGGYGQYVSGSTEYVGAADNYWYGPLAVVCVYGRTLSSNEQKALHGAVRNRYGI
jgi:hypothetical protein